MVSQTSWFTNKSQFNIFQSALDRSRLVAKLGMSQRMEAETAKLDQKYDGSKAAALQEQAEKLAETKGGIEAYHDRVEYALKKFNDVRIQLLSAKAAITTGSAAAFDLGVNTNNAWLARKVTFPDSLITNTGDGRGHWSQATEMVSGEGMEVAVKEHYLGNDYAIVIPGSPEQVLRPSKDGSKIEGGSNGAVAMSDWTVDSQTGDQVTVTDNLNGVSYTGTLKRGGLGVLNAWAYGNLATDEGKAAAKADIDAALKQVTKLELEYRSNDSGLESIVKSMDGKIKNLSDEYTKIAEEELSAKQAERRAIKSRFDIATNALALTTGTATNFIYQLFNNPLYTDKKDLAGVLMDAVKGK